MSWHLYSWTFKLLSSLHIGYKNVMNYSSTRYYILGKLFWAALTAKFTRLLKKNNYREVGEFLKESMRFGYAYPYVNGDLFLPRYDEKKGDLIFGSLSKHEFEKKMVRSKTSVAIDPGSLSAEEGMLYEFEYINPYLIDDKPAPVYFKGLLWVKELQKTAKNSFFIERENGKLFLGYDESKFDFKETIANRFQVGGERRYGFGLLELSSKSTDNFKEIPNKTLEDFSGEWFEENKNICVKIAENNAIWAHLLNTKDMADLKNIEIAGDIEFLQGRDWDNEKGTGAGRKLNPYGFVWCPGSVINKGGDKKVSFIVNEFGLFLIQ